MVDFSGPGTCPEEDSPDSQLSDSDIESSIPTETYESFQREVVGRNKCVCGSWRYIESVKKLLRKPNTYSRMTLTCSKCGTSEQFVFRMGWLTR